MNNLMKSIALSAWMLCSPLAMGGTPARADATTAPAITAIHMCDSSSGWGVSDAGVLRTIDAGKTWKVVIPAADPEQYFRGGFVDAKTACVTILDDDHPGAIIARTTDGGAHWTHTLLARSTVVMSAQFYFCARHAWVMLIPDHTMNSSPGILYRSDDQGGHWREIASTDKELPYGGDVSFRDQSVGWIAGSLESTTPSLLSMTRDGGRTWARLNLAMPADFPRGTAAPVHPPQFFAPGQGLLVASFGEARENAPGRTILYTTHDGGESWNSVPLAVWVGASSFNSLHEGWIWSTEARDNHRAPVIGTLAHTIDGGKTWTPLESKSALTHLKPALDDVEQLQFVDAHHGWAITSHMQPAPYHLFSTADGGVSWIKLHPSLQH